jgi:hypothetical protein
VCFYTNIFDLSRDYNNFLCLDSEKDVKDAIVKYLTDLLNGRIQITDDYDLDIYVSTDAFISKDHDESDDVVICSDIIDGNVYDDEDGNSWVSIHSLSWGLGWVEPMTTFWSAVLGNNLPT